MVIVMIIAMLATVAVTGPGDYVSTNTSKQEHRYEPGSNRK